MDTIKLQSEERVAALSDTAIAWTVVLLVSDLPEAIWQAAGGIIPGWLYATMMIETRGIVMSWFNHFLTNFPTFIFWVMAAIAR